MVATLNTPEPVERTIMKDQPDWNKSFIENTIIADKNKLQLCFLQEEFTIFIASDGVVYNHEGFWSSDIRRERTARS
jgi:hypothetical protein